ncbi:MAG TPA: hypothetical protein VH350_15580 [Candidatus Sulfotelmatobacter sp.]|jgi:hypothetical protein|nr:hypothetical protein [Candidatus Sulfotelmatobacter sp.]
MTRKNVVAAVIVATLVLVVYYLYGGSTVPSGQQPLVRLNPSNLASLRSAFNQSSDSIRVLALVSPT